MGSILFNEEIMSATPQMALKEFQSKAHGENDYRMSGDPDTSGADLLSLGRCLKTYANYSDSFARREEVKKIADKHYPETSVTDYINTGKCGYYRIEAKVMKNKKRGKTYYVAMKRNSMFGSFNRMRSFGTKKEAEDYAKKTAANTMEDNVFVINGKNEVLGEVYFDFKYYKTKPSLTPKEGRILAPAYKYLLIGSAYVG